MKRSRLHLLWLILPAVLFYASCSNDDEPPLPTVTRTWNINLIAANELNVPAGRTDSGTAVLTLYSDNSLQYQITVEYLAPGDALTASHIHAGDAVNNAPVYIEFPGPFSSNMLNGTVALTAAQADSIQNFPMYVNVHSTQSPGGIMRGQMDKNLIFSVNVPLSGVNEVPAVVTTATGTAYLRLADDNTLFSKVDVTGLETNDTLTAAHIHTAATGVNGNVLVGLCDSAEDFGITQTTGVTTEQATTILTDAVYVNAHSKRHPAGIIRGQIR